MNRGKKGKEKKRMQTRAEVTDQCCRPVPVFDALDGLAGFCHGVVPHVLLLTHLGQFGLETFEAVVGDGVL